ncbi:MAG: hypothetical protein JXR25_06270 [Pontiellaceae bacterium]|nr:hypothetical protein [Pontiellaceae bacterium]MBN2784414.1 hypothetical protein [Pontiellaceae bacterium]
MKILFVTFGYLSAGAGATRSVSLLRVLADAGHQVDVVASMCDIAEHGNINILCGEAAQQLPRRRIRLQTLRALSRTRYAVIHAVDDAMLMVSRFRIKRSLLVYEASRCFSGTSGEAPGRYWRLFPNQCRRAEERMLEHSSLVLCSGNDLSVNLKRIVSSISVSIIEDIPAQPLFPVQDIERDAVLSFFPSGTTFLGVCSVVCENCADLRTLLLGVRKLIDKVPGAGFYFKGLNPDKAIALAANLEIERRCVFLSPQDEGRFLSALSVADTSLFIPRQGARYAHPEVLSLMNSPALLVALDEPAYNGILSDRNCIRVDYTAQSIADGLLSVSREPLLALGLVSEARQLIADRYSFSSFKHRVRMAYHDLTHKH